ncbi:MAG: deoxyribodipyrimidine photolyase [Candidatus Poseidoniales archaeon]|nr:MAG: deoxyribodipyrimidine photolyase [Candidatus Poseidoniales archaeon]
MIPSSRLNIHGAPNTDGEVIVYWMTAARRPYRNHALEHAVNLAREHGLPLVVIECLALHHRWANDRISTFVLQGMSDNRETFSTSGVTYVPYVETKRKEASTLLKTWLHHAFACVIDDYPTYYPKHVLNTALEVKPCEVHVVDSNGFMAMRAQGRDFSTAYSLRRHLHKTIREHMHEFPASRPLDGTEDLPIYDEKKIHAVFELANTPVTPYEFIWRVSEGGDVGRNALSTLSIDHDVQPVLGKRGGHLEGRRRWKEFFADRLSSYHEKRNKPQERGASGLSPWLHFGHISVHAILHDIFTHHRWDVSLVNPPNDGRRRGWWGLNEPVEAFLDQIITWRDIGFIHCAMIENHTKYESLPLWARNTLGEHAEDERPYLYTFEELETATTHDPLWNAAQNQLRQEGIIHNYLRMLWGKKILEWSPSPEIAMEWMIALNDRWALDGRDPNSYTGIGWVLGKFDRGWTERPVYGKIRCMTSASTARKFSTKDYVEKYNKVGGKSNALGSGPSFYSAHQ